MPKPRSRPACTCASIREWMRLILMAPRARCGRWRGITTRESHDAGILRKRKIRTRSQTQICLLRPTSRAEDGIRTRDLSITNRLHYHCATSAFLRIKKRYLPLYRAYGYFFSNQALVTRRFQILKNPAFYKRLTIGEPSVNRSNPL